MISEVLIHAEHLRGIIGTNSKAESKQIKIQKGLIGNSYAASFGIYFDD